MNATLLNARLISPRTLEEAYAALAADPGGIKLLAGGTDLFVLANAGLLDAERFLDLWALDELRGIIDEGDSVRLGALTTYTQLIRSPLVGAHAPALVEASRTVGAAQIQNRGTLGGNVVNASPAGDTLPVLAACDAVLEVGGPRGERLIPFHAFYTGYRRTVLAPDEILLAVRLPKPRPDERTFFFKVGTRRAQAISKVVLALRINACGSSIREVAIGLGSLAPTVIRAPRTEALLRRTELTPDLARQAQLLLTQEVMPIDDLRSTAHYRRTVTGNLLARALRLYL
jgi:CO/xanthine dehydrogenase FAD-binding subunit